MVDEIRCPNCDHLNPPGEQKCQSCQQPLQADALPAQEGGLPDWLGDLQGTGDQALGGAAEGAADMPDWLAGLSGADQSAEPGASDAGGEPDWLSDLLGGQETGAAPAETPDWLKAEASQAAPPFSADTPDWLQTPPAQPAQPAAQENAPDWLTALPPAETPAAGQTPAFLTDEPAEAQPAPDWLDGLSQPSAPPPAAETPAFILDEPPAESGAAASDFLTTLPDWVSQVSAEDIAPEETSAEGEANLAQSSLPTWLEAMRPVESAAPSATPFEDVSGSEVVTSGPLAGLRGVLMAEPDVALPHKPPAYSVKLRVTDEQKSRVAMLEELLASEDKPKPQAAAHALSQQFIFRLVIALALILPILWMTITGSTSLAAPAADTLPGVSEMRAQVASMPRGAPVLVAFDYEPGFSGEVEAAAAAVLAHIMQQDAYLVLVSTSPTGPVLAQSLLDEMTYTNYLNLGYVPGGAAGLLGLAQSPSLAMPYTLQDAYAWSQPLLSQVNTAADFALVLVLTDDPNTGRSWIEQVGPTLAEQATPLLMVTSAQAEPLLRPYLGGTNPQVQGLVSGLAGGVAYGAVQGSAGAARSMWNAFGAGMLAAALIIVVGSLFFRLLAARPAKPPRKEK